MKNGIFKILISVLLSLATLIMLASPVLASLDDFTTWTEVDPNSKITVYTDNIVWTGISNDENAFVYYLSNTDYDFHWQFQFEITTISSSSDICLLGASNGTIPWNAWGNNVGILAWYEGVNTFKLTTRETQDSDSQGFGISGLSTGTSYYVDFEGSSSNATATMTIWTDNFFGDEFVGTANTGLRYTLFTYLFIASVYDMNDIATQTGIIQNINFGALSIPEVTTLDASNIEYNYLYDAYQVDLNANVADDGGANVSGGFFYRNITSEEWSWAGDAGSYTTGDNFSVTLFDGELGEEYQYYAYINNGEYIDYGDNVSYIIEPEADIPVMQTLMYPFNSNSDDLWANLYGQVTWDGNSSSNVSGWIQYKESTSGIWLNSSDNITDLESGDLYSANVTGLSLYISYDFCAVGSNAEGIGYAPSIGNFYLGDEIIAPTLTTDNATFITDTSARLYGTLTDDGNDSLVWVYFRYRLSGETLWSETTGVFVAENTSFSKLISGLASNSNYQYQAVGYTNNPDYTKNYGYGTIKTFSTYSSISIPIMSTDNVSYLVAGTVAVTGTVQYDGGSPVDMWFQARIYGAGSWTDSDYILPNYETGEQGTWYISGLENNQQYQVRSVGRNFAGTGYGNIITFTMSETLGTSEIETPFDPFADAITNLQNSWGMTGVFGTWAFMGVILIIVSVFFGLPVLIVRDRTLKIILAGIWGLISITIVGGFLFSGKLGIWPIVILASALVLLVFVILRIIGSGGSNDG